MTKVNLTITRDYEDVPSEFAKHLEKVCEKLKELLQGVRTLERATTLGIPVETMPMIVVDLSKNLDTLKDMFQDAYNISNSFSNLEKEKAKNEEQSSIIEQVESYKSQIQQNVDKLVEQNEQYKVLVRKLQDQVSDLKKVPPPAKNKTTKTKTTKKK